PSPSATRWGWTTSPALRSGSRSPGSPPPRPPSPTARRSAATADRELGAAGRRQRIGPTEVHPSGGPTHFEARAPRDLPMGPDPHARGAEGARLASRRRHRVGDYPGAPAPWPSKTATGATSSSSAG